MEFIDCTGMHINKLTAMSHFRRGEKTMWRCVCDCGNETVVEGYAFRSGGVKSCGCLKGKRENCENRKDNPLYSIWHAMKRRCHAPKAAAYKNYGGRGIVVCDEWRCDFRKFDSYCRGKGWHEGLSIDRIDNNGNYEPGNIRFVSMKAQNRNRRDNVIVIWRSKEYYATDLAEIAGVGTSTISRWIKAGVIIDKMENGKAYAYKGGKRVANLA